VRNTRNALVFGIHFSLSYLTTGAEVAGLPSSTPLRGWFCGGNIKFWSEICEIPESQISFVNVLKGKKVGKLLFGMCRVRITKGGYTLKVVQSIQGVIRDRI